MSALARLTVQAVKTCINTLSVQPSKAVGGNTEVYGLAFVAIPKYMADLGGNAAAYGLAWVLILINYAT